MFSIAAYIRVVEGYNWYFVVGIWHMSIGILVVMCCWSCWFSLRLHKSEVVAHGLM
jgi:hypothetical protein